jgi:hypothetical protein
MDACVLVDEFVCIYHVLFHRNPTMQKLHYFINDFIFSSSAIGSVIALCPQIPKQIRGGRSHCTTPANQLMVIVLKIWSLSNPQRDLLITGPTALTYKVSNRKKSYVCDFVDD